MEMLHFERELPTYAEPVSIGDMMTGETYFSVQYVDAGFAFSNN